MLFELLKLEFATSCILYIGYSNRDPNWNTVINEMSSEFYPTPLPRAYRIAPYTDPLEIEILKEKNIETIQGHYVDFCEAGRQQLSMPSDDELGLRKYRGEIPSDLLGAFDTSPAAVTRLLDSWMYVNQEAFHGKPNLSDYLRGDRPNWSLVGSSLTFERDIKEEIFEKLLDDATSSSNKPSVNIILAPAGYGTTTLLMTLTARLIDERAGAVFMLKPGAAVTEGVIEFATSIFPANAFFVVDNAADNCSELRSAVGRLTDLKKSPTFILGERLNEWRQSSSKPSGTEYELGPLSDLEIYRLIDYLTEHNELGVLADLNREMQFALIKEKHGKQLLVVMREATEGKSFDAILEDEYRNIGDALSRRLYLAVSCFYQHGVYARAALLAKILDIPLAEMYEATTDATEGVVIYECLQKSEERYGARARHRTIASVVWERCGIIGEREGILQAALDALNLNYAVDKNAFEYFVRSDRLVEDIRTLDGKIRFFDRACQKDPYSPYVRQHYARMFLREKKYELALDQIDKALELAPRIRVLHHTKGHILHEYAMEVESLELARRRLVQSEDSFLEGLRLSPRDDFCYQGLARLYFGWAKRLWQHHEDEATEYISKAEEVITEGLRTVRVRDSLWVVSAEIQAWLGDEHGRIEALEKAVVASPQSIVPRYLLGRAYRKLYRLDEALQVLEPIIKNHFDNFRAFVEYAVSLILLGRPYSEAIAYLKQSTLYGLRDPRFIATLGGMLFMNGEFSEAIQIFNEASKHDFTSHELNTVQFAPPDPSNTVEPLRIPGKVISVKAGYCFVEAPRYSTFLCPGSLFNGVVMREGLEVTFQPAFRAKGAIAYQPQALNKA